MVNKYADLAARLAQPVCLVCGGRSAHHGLICAQCLGDLRGRQVPRCLQCAQRLPVAGLCGACLRQPPHYDRVIAAFSYAFPIDRLIIAGKFRGQLEVLALLGQLMADCLLSSVGTLPDVLVPVPLSAHRLRGRGFNQARELARVIAARLEVPMDVQSCWRSRHTAEQTTLDPAQRRRNVRGCFERKAGLKWQHVAIIDDVMTTGATVSELARVLKHAGVARVDVWVCARAAEG